MAHFGIEELLDSIKYGLAIEDDTGFSTKVLGKAVRRCKPGGLPLSLAAQTDSSDSDHSPPFQIRPSDNQPTSALCHQSVAKKVKDVQNLIQARRTKKPNLNQEQIDHYFAKHDVPSARPQTSKSLLSHQIEQCQKEVSDEKFGEFSKHEAFENEPNSKLIYVTFPFAEHSPEEPPKTVSIRAKNSATMEEFIGLCCFFYTRANFKPKCLLEPWRYSLYMADDSYDFDIELPPIDRNRTVGECGFTMLALVENKSEEVTKPNKYIVNVYTMNNQKFVFELNSLNESLEWLRDEALKKKQESDDQKRLNMRQTTYELQSLDNEQPLKLSKTIASTGLLDFLLIRKNSSRANFNPSSLIDPSSNDVTGPRAPLFVHVQTKQRPMQLAPISSSSTASPKTFNNIDSPTTSIRSGQLGQSNLIQEYVVDRVHRLKAKSTSKLAIHDNFLEITPILSEKRRAFVPQSIPKYTTIAWDLIGGIESEKHSNRRSTRIFWLPVTAEIFELQDRYQKHISKMQKKFNDAFYLDAPQQLSESSRFSSHSTNAETDTTSSSPSKTAPHSTRPSVNEGTLNTNEDWPNDYNLMALLLKAYDQLAWKSFQIETNDDDSWQINMKIIEIIDFKNSFINQIFKNSSGGSKRPKLAFEETFNLKGGNYSPNESKRQSMAPSSSVSNLKAYKKRKSINPVPLLNRMLSKQD